MKRVAVFFVVLVACPLFISCETLFSYSPYDGQVDEALRHTTARNLKMINVRDAGDSRPFKIAVLSDTHYHFDRLHDAITHINQKNDISFVVVTGDISDNGLLKEFMLFNDIMGYLKVPYVTVIGNHDYLSNGELVYEQMFGAFNYSFAFNNVKFVMFDNVRWESQKVPDFNWLATALENDRGYDHVIPFTHIPSFDGQMQDFAERFHQLLVDNGLTISIHGHAHKYSQLELYGNGVEYVTIPSPQQRSYAEITITPDAITVANIDY